VPGAPAVQKAFHLEYVDFRPDLKDDDYALLIDMPIPPDTFVIDRVAGKRYVIDKQGQVRPTTAPPLPPETHGKFGLYFTASLIYKSAFVLVLLVLARRRVLRGVGSLFRAAPAGTRQGP
jgi:hypothetical protein